MLDGPSPLRLSNLRAGGRRGERTSARGKVGYSAAGAHWAKAPPIADDMILPRHRRHTTQLAWKLVCVGGGWWVGACCVLCGRAVCVNVNPRTPPLIAEKHALRACEDRFWAIQARSVLGSWVKPCGTRLGIRKCGKGAVRLPNILVLSGSFWANVRLLSSWHGPQATLKCSYCSNRVTRY